jgi:O-acetylhomoserine (thiol)-lyase
VFCFDLPGGREHGMRFIEALSLFSHLANVGDAKSLVIHPASTTHRQLNDEELAGAGIRPGTVRLSIGIEDADDLVWDLERGLEALG